MNKLLAIISIVLLMSITTLSKVNAETESANLKKYTHETSEWYVKDIETEPNFQGKNVFTFWNYEVKDTGMSEQYVIAITYDASMKLAVDNTHESYTYVKLFGTLNQPLSANSLELYQATESGWEPFTPYNENCTVYKYDNYIRLYHARGWFAPQEAIGDVYTGSYLDDDTASIVGTTSFFRSTSCQLRSLISLEQVKKVLAQVLELIPIVIPVIVSYIALRKGLALLATFLRMA